MSGPAKNDRLIRFSVFELDRDSGELFKQGRKIKLQGQPFELLVALLDRPGEVLSREELRQKVWPTDTAGDFDHGLNRAVNKVREALGDSPETPRFIETLPRRGYRFIAPIIAPIEKEPPRVPSPVDVRAAARLPPDAPPTPPPAPDPSARKPRSARHWFARVGTAAAVILVAGAGVLYYRHFEQAPTASDNLPPPVPFTTYPGFQWAPTFSPEGSRVAFAWDQPGKRPSNIFVKLIGGSEPVPLTTANEGDFAPAWSPDGRYIAFLRTRGPFTTAVMLIPSLGGPERELTRVHLDAALFFELRGWVPASPLLAWSSDNKWLLAVQQTESDAVRAVRISVESGEQTQVKLVPDSSGNRAYGSFGAFSGGAGLALSPDGKTLAFAHSVDFPNNELFAVRLSGDMLPVGPPRSLHFESGFCAGVGWAPDGQNLVVSCDRRGAMELWKVPLTPRSEPAPLNVSDSNPREVAVSKTGQRLVFTHYSGDVDIWRVDLRSALLKAAAPFMVSTRGEMRPAYSSDGNRIAFESNRTGNEEIWTSNADGSNALQLTSFANGYAGSPNWSPDDRQIAFDGYTAGKWNVYIIASKGGKSVRFTQGAGSSSRPSWSHDGKWIYYCAFESSGPQIWKKPAAGGAEMQLTKNGGCSQVESADGAYVYYLKPGERALWRVPSGGGQESQVLTLTHETQFALGIHGAYLMEAVAPVTLKYFDFASGAIKVLGMLPGTVFHDDGLTVSPDEHWLLYGKNDFAGSQLMLVEKFR